MLGQGLEEGSAASLAVKMGRCSEAVLAGHSEAESESVLGQGLAMSSAVGLDCCSEVLLARHWAVESV